jgi:biopolymer transport protein ExbB
MIVKTMSLNRIQKDNQGFMRKFRKLDASDTGSLDHPEDFGSEDEDLAESPVLKSLFGDHDHFQSSSLYRIYHTGISEVNSRIGASVGAKATLTPQGMGVIRAMLCVLEVSLPPSCFGSEPNDFFLTTSQFAEDVSRLA